MGLHRFFVSLLTGSSMAWAARDTGTIDQAAARVEQFAAQSAPALRTEFRILAAEALKDRYPDVAGGFIREVFEDVRSRTDIDRQTLSALAVLAAEETIALLPHLGPGSDFMVADALMRAN